MLIQLGPLLSEGGPKRPRGKRPPVLHAARSEPSETVAAEAAEALAGGDEDASLSRRALELAADLTTPSRAIYWLDLTLTAVVAWSTLWLAADAAPVWIRLAAGVVAVFSLYRGVSFIHELTHLQPGEIPGFKLAWNAVIGVPFLAPSFLYEGVHVLHHVKDRYGTAGDPEYLPLSRSTPLRIAGFVAAALLAPVAMLVRFGVAAPLSLLAPALRRSVVERMSAMTINPAFKRGDAPAARRPAWLAQEIACWLWCWTVVGLTVTGALPERYLLTGLAVLALVALVNQLRTAGAHAWTSDGEPMSVLEQFKDSVNMPPPAMLPMVWAPVGPRYHALHHLLPRLPYHSLGEAHRRLVAAVPEASAYHAPTHRNLAHALGRLLARARAATSNQTAAPGA